MEMFKQMAISAPIAMVIIFLLMLFFFRKLVLVLSPMIVAMVSVISTMGLLVMTGNTVHIMSSMIPIFIMPIAVLDAVHILSEFFDRYPETRKRRETILAVMNTLSRPMLYTSLTTAAGFASLALTPIPPVQIFGLFIAFGVLCAWVWTVVFIPAFITFIPKKSLENFGHRDTGHDEAPSSLMGRFLAATGRLTTSKARAVLALTIVVSAVAVVGITRIRINDNPTKWFNAKHPIRVADRVLNAPLRGHLHGLPGPRAGPGRDRGSRTRSQRWRGNACRPRRRTWKGTSPGSRRSSPSSRPRRTASRSAWPMRPPRPVRPAARHGSTPSMPSPRRKPMRPRAMRPFAWDETLLFIDRERGRDQLFKRPEVLRYVEGLQAALNGLDVVGKSNSLPDLVKTVHRELFEGNPERFTIPDTSNAVAQCLITFQNSHRPHDLWHFVTPDFRKSVVWVQLRSGDNVDMQRVVRAADDYVAANPPPAGLVPRWFGLTYINVVWQDKMVSGMLEAFFGSFLIVFFMMTLVFRSALWGFLSMVPLTVTIGLIYGVIGLIGKEYDMPVAVLSSLSIGLAVDYAIHFLARSRELREKHGTWAATAGPVFRRARPGHLPQRHRGGGGLPALAGGAARALQDGGHLHRRHPPRRGSRIPPDPARSDQGTREAPFPGDREGEFHLPLRDLRLRRSEPSLAGRGERPPVHDRGMERADLAEPGRHRGARRDLPAFEPGQAVPRRRAAGRCRFRGFHELERSLSMVSPYDLDRCRHCDVDTDRDAPLGAGCRKERRPARTPPPRRPS